MSEPAVFEICFPSHITRMPVCRPGETIAGVVVLKLSAPVMASHLLLQLCGAERVRRSPVAVRTELAERKQQQTTMSQQMVMDKEFFRRQLVLWGDSRQLTHRQIPGDAVHRFHFSFTMPYVNMPAPRQTPDIEISYSLEASLFTELSDQQRSEKAARGVHKTSSKCFRFEPVLQHLVDYSVAAPFETVVSMIDAAPLPAPDSRHPVPSLPSLAMLPFHSARRSHMTLNVFQPTSAFLPGETVDLLLLVRSGKKITNALFQVRENVRCRKSSAPIIDESDVPVLWKYSVDLTQPQEISFSKLTKTALAQDTGALGHRLFTSQAAAPQGIPQGIPGDMSALASPPPAAPLQSLSSHSTAASISGDQAARPLRVKPEDALAISNVHLAGARGQLSPLAESHEGAGGNSTDSVDSAGTVGIPEASPRLPHSSPPLAQVPPRSRTGSLGAITVPHHYPQSVYASGVASAAPGAAGQPHHPWSRAIGMSGSRMSKRISPDDIDDSISDRSSISDTLSIRYQPTKAVNFPSLNRGSSTGGGGAARSVAAAAARSGTVPAPLGGLLGKGSYKFARIRFTLPPITEMSPVSSVYLDFEYAVDISMSIGGSFGTTKRAIGRLPLRIATVRAAAKPGSLGAACSTELGSQAMTDPAASTSSLRDSMSCLNLSIAQSDDALSSALTSNGSPANTLTEVYFEGPGAATAPGDLRLADGSYPCLLSFIQNGEKVPAPALEFINIGTKLV
ncbi:hypothetical protein H4R19_002982 [Coemansia spiralis]|nr:hypothetical protein H4R19_002982 [Coemansia spiralis]